jgi:hypothetical protein
MRFSIKYFFISLYFVQGSFCFAQFKISEFQFGYTKGYSKIKDNPTDFFKPNQYSNKNSFFLGIAKPYRKGNLSINFVHQSLESEKLIFPDKWTYYSKTNFNYLQFSYLKYKRFYKDLNLIYGFSGNFNFGNYSIAYIIDPLGQINSKIKTKNILIGFSHPNQPRQEPLPESNLLSGNIPLGFRYSFEKFGIDCIYNLGITSTAKNIKELGFPFNFYQTNLNIGMFYNLQKKPKK